MTPVFYELDSTSGTLLIVAEFGLWLHHAYRIRYNPFLVVRSASDHLQLTTADFRRQHGGGERRGVTAMVPGG